MLSPQRGGVLESLVFYQMPAGGPWRGGKSCRMSPPFSVSLCSLER